MDLPEPALMFQFYLMSASITMLMLIAIVYVLEYTLNISSNLNAYRRVPISYVQLEIKKISISVALLFAGLIINISLIYVNYGHMFFNFIPFKLQVPDVNVDSVYNVRDVSKNEYVDAYHQLYKVHLTLEIREPHPVTGWRILFNAINKRYERLGFVSTMKILSRLLFRPLYRAVSTIKSSLQNLRSDFRSVHHLFTLYLHEKVSYNNYCELRTVFTMINEYQN